MSGTPPIFQDPLMALQAAGSMLMNEQLRRLKHEDPAGVEKVTMLLDAGMMPRLVITWAGRELSAQCVLVNDMGDPVIQVFEIRAEKLMTPGDDAKH